MEEIILCSRGNNKIPFVKRPEVQRRHNCEAKSRMRRKDIQDSGDVRFRREHSLDTHPEAVMCELSVIKVQISLSVNKAEIVI